MGLARFCQIKGRCGFIFLQRPRREPNSTLFAYLLPQILPITRRILSYGGKKTRQGTFWMCSVSHCWLERAAIFTAKIGLLSELEGSIYSEGVYNEWVMTLFSLGEGGYMSCSVLNIQCPNNTWACVPPRTRKYSPQPENPILPHLIYQDLLIDLS